MTATFFAALSDFRKWQETNYNTETELIVGYYKVHTEKPTMSWSKSVNQALCYGWIDGVRRKIDEESYFKYIYFAIINAYVLKNKRI